MVGTAQSEPGVDETGTGLVTMGNGLYLQSGIWIDAFFCIVFPIVFTASFLYITGFFKNFLLIFDHYTCPALA